MAEHEAKPDRDGNMHGWERGNATADPRAILCIHVINTTPAEPAIMEAA